MQPVGRGAQNARNQTSGSADSPSAVASPRERRQVNRFLYYWAALRRNSPLPSIDELDITCLPSDWDQCFLMAQSGLGAPAEFDHLGALFLADCGRRRLDPGAPVPRDSLLDLATRSAPVAAAERLPVITSGSLPGSASRHIKFRSITLPFEGRSSGNLYLLGAANWREDSRVDMRDREPLRCYKFDCGVWVAAKLPDPASRARTASER